MEIGRFSPIFGKEFTCLAGEFAHLSEEFYSFSSFFYNLAEQEADSTKSKYKGCHNGDFEMA